MSGLTALVVEDESAQRDMLAEALREMGHRAFPASGCDGALQVLEETSVDVVLTDLRMPGDSGLDLLRTVRERYPSAAVVLITAFGTVDQAVEAMKQGAADFIGKPVDLDRLESILDRIAERQRLVREVRQLRSRIAEKYSFDNVVGSSGRMQEVLALTARVAPSTSTVLVTGESGTGKELIANLLHEHSARASGPFVKVHCAALPETLLEAELFGHVRGAFTGAQADRRGRFEEADGGTIFLDEIGEIPPATQVKLLRVLQEREITRLGENRSRSIDVRIVAATHRDLEEEVRAGRFREDLYYRIHVLTVHMPPLRDRRDDIPELVEWFLKQHGRRDDGSSLSVSREAMDVLLRHPFPGNVRELENVVERACLLARGDLVRVEDLPERMLRPAEGAAALPEETGELALPDAVGRLEARLIRAALRRHDGVVARAARDLGIHERVLRYKLKKGLHGESES